MSTGRAIWEFSHRPYTVATHQSAGERTSKLWATWTLDSILLHQGLSCWRATAMPIMYHAEHEARQWNIEYSHGKSKTRQSYTWWKSESVFLCEEGRTDWKWSLMNSLRWRVCILCWVMTRRPNVWNCQNSHNLVLKICALHVSHILISKIIERKSLLTCLFNNSMFLL